MALTGVVAFALVGCRTAGSNRQPTSTGSFCTALSPRIALTSCFLATPLSQVMLIEFTRSENHISGSVEIARLTSDGTDVKSYNGAVTGAIFGSAITIDDENSLLTSKEKAIDGTLRPGDLVLLFPLRGDGLSRVSFTSSNLVTYDLLVTALQEAANTNLKNMHAIESGAVPPADAFAHQYWSGGQIYLGVLSYGRSIRKDVSRLAKDDRALAADSSYAQRVFQLTRTDVDKTETESPVVKRQICAGASLVADDYTDYEKEQGAFDRSVLLAQRAVSSTSSDILQLQLFWIGIPALSGFSSLARTSAALTSAGKSALSKFHRAVGKDTQTMIEDRSHIVTMLGQANQLCYRG
jgi:hypothetical protein